MAHEPSHDEAGGRHPSVLLVTGSGRSGTSSLAGSLKLLGLHVPQPEVAAQETNVKGFFEPKWVIHFHKRHFKPLHLHNIDARPDAPAIVAESLSDGAAAQELKGWLADQLQFGQLVVKDPLAFWFIDVWKVVTDSLGVELKVLTSLRHPAEVVGSRDLAYLQHQGEDVRLVKETSNVAGWIHAALLTEIAGRDRARAFLRYPDLIADWRSTLSTTGHQLGLDYDVDVTDPQRRSHPVDEFLDSSLRRSRLTWDDLRVPGWLRDMAEEVWNTFGRLVEAPQDATALARLDELHTEYDARFREAVAFTFDHTNAQVRQLRSTTRRLKQRNRDLRAELKGLRS